MPGVLYLRGSAAVLIGCMWLASLPAAAQDAQKAKPQAPARAVKPFQPPPPHSLPEPLLESPPEGLLARSDPDQVTPSEATLRQSLLGRTQEALPPPPAATVIRAILGLVALTVLAWIGGTRRVQTLEREWNIAHLMTTGLPFVLLGLIAALPEMGILTPSVLREVAPLLPLGLGWIGFVIGLRFDVRTVERAPQGTGTSVLVMTAFPAALMMAGLALMMSLIDAERPNAPLLRDALLLATAGTMAARRTPSLLRSLLPHQQVSERLIRIVDLEQLAGVFGLMMIAAYYRPPQSLVAWQLPGTAWLFLTLGIGTTMGVVLYATLTRINKGPQFTAVLLGYVAFIAGMASHLRLSPVAVCFLAGAITINIGGDWKTQLRDVFERLERPVYFLFMVIAGALWHPWEWQGWVLMLAFVTFRIVSKWVTSGILKRWFVPDVTPDERRALVTAPMGALSVAIVVSAQDLYSGPTLTWIVTAVIAGSLVTEIALQAARRRMRHGRAGEAPASTYLEPEVD